MYPMVPMRVHGCTNTLAALGCYDYIENVIVTITITN